MAFVYGLTDPRIGVGRKAIRYIGKADDPKRRVRVHMIPSNLCAHSGRSYKQNWLKQLRRAGLKPGLLLLEEVTKRRWKAAERKWIKHFREKGVRLTNTAPGGLGDGREPGFKHSDKTRRKMSLAAMGNTRNKGKRMSEETKRKIGEANRKRRTGARATEATKRKLSRVLMGNTRARGHTHTVAWRKKMSERMKGNTYGLGHKHTTEWRKEMKARWARGEGRNQHTG